MSTETRNAQKDMAADKDTNDLHLKPSDAVNCIKSMVTIRGNWSSSHSEGCLLGYESGPGRGIRSSTYAIGLISWAASEGSTVSSLFSLPLVDP